MSLVETVKLDFIENKFPEANMATPEGRVKAWFASEVKKRYPLAKRIRVPAGQYGTKGVSDDILCIDGYFIAVEAKAHADGQPTPIQAQFLRDVIAAGGLGLVLRGRDPGIFIRIDQWIRDQENYPYEIYNL